MNLRRVLERCPTERIESEIKKCLCDQGGQLITLKEALLQRQRAESEEKRRREETEERRRREELAEKRRQENAKKEAEERRQREDAEERRRRHQGEYLRLARELLQILLVAEKLPLSLNDKRETLGSLSSQELSALCSIGDSAWQARTSRMSLDDFAEPDLLDFNPGAEYPKYAHWLVK